MPECIPTIHIAGQSTAEDSEGESAAGGGGSTGVAKPILVSVSAGECLRFPNHPSQDYRPVGEPSGRTSPKASCT